VTELLVQSLRGRVVESVHRVSVAVVDAGGRLHARSGDPELVTFARSAAKPFQALPLLEDGAAERFGVREDELALICASHNSEPAQVELVRGLLARVGLSESDLACGPHRPLSVDLAILPIADFGLRNADWVPEQAPVQDVPPTTQSAIRNPQSAMGLVGGRVGSNCSGKHTGMLALARHHGWPTAGYHQPAHPVQRRCKETMARWTDLPVDRIGEGVDGCGVVSFALPVVSLALAYARLGTSGEAAPQRVVRAMTHRPDLVAGQGRPCTALMQAYPGRVLAKVGAAGVYGVAMLDRGLGIGLKVEDGDTWAAVLALWVVLEQLGLDPPPSQSLPRIAALPVRNTRGETVGSLEATGKLTFV
jgi:L-asparaginase II